MTVDPDSLATLNSRQCRLASLDAPAFAPLETCRRDIAARFGPTPHVDPLDGGVNATLLLLLETPAPRGEAPRFVSRDNPTGTARNLRRFLSASGIERRQSLLWNAVPWIIHAPGARNRAPTRSEAETGLSLLSDFISLLPVLRVVVTAGRTAALALPLLRIARPDLELFAMPHPSPVYVNTSPSIAERITAALDAASECLAVAALRELDTARDRLPMD